MPCLPAQLTQRRRAHMRSRRHLVPIGYALLLGCVVAAGSLRLVAQAPDAVHADLSGRWERNAELRENAYQKLEAMHSSHFKSRENEEGVIESALATCVSLLRDAKAPRSSLRTIVRRTGRFLCERRSR